MPFLKKIGLKAFKKDEQKRRERQRVLSKHKLDDEATKDDNGKEAKINDAEYKEKILQQEYKTYMGLNPLDETSKPTPEYEEWKVVRKKYDYLLEIAKKELEKDIDLLEVDTKKGKRQAKEERLRKCAFDVAKHFSHAQIKTAIDGKGGYEVHGYIQDNYWDYDWLIDNYVLDRALYYSRRYYTPEIYKFLKELDLEKLKITRIELIEPDILNNYPNLEYKYVLVLAQDDLNKALTWIPNFKHEINEYEVRVKFAPANLGLLGWSLWNVLTVVVLHAVGKSQGLFDAKMEAKKLVKLEDDIKTKIIHQYRTYIKPLEDKSDEYMRESLQTEKKYKMLQKRLETSVPSDVLQEFQDLERKAMKGKGLASLNWKNIGLAILIIAILITAIILVIFFVGRANMIFPTNSTSTASILINNYFRWI